MSFFNGFITQKVTCAKDPHVLIRRPHAPARKNPRRRSEGGISRERV